MDTLNPQNTPFSGPAAGTDPQAPPNQIPSPVVPPASQTQVPSVASQMPPIPVQSIVNPPPAQQTPAGIPNLAAPGQRFLAQVIDSAILLVVYIVLSFPIGMATGALSDNSSTPSTTSIWIGIIAQLAISAINIFYYIYFIGKTGQTPGKSAMKIKVIKVNPQEKVGYIGAFLRETIGKLISALGLLIGYLSIFWDKNRQGWHDKIAGTIVVKTSQDQF